MHILAIPLRDKINEAFNNANLKCLHHGMGKSEPWLMTTSETDSLIFAHGRIVFEKDHLCMALRVVHEFDFKFEVLLGSLSPADIEQHKSFNNDGYIYGLKFDYTLPNLVDVIGELVGATAT